MKKVVLFIAVLSATSFASCKKDRVCTCVSTFTPTGGSALPSTTDITTYTKSSKASARAHCLSNSFTDNDGTRTETCTLK